MRDQGELSQGQHGNHLRPAVDYLIAATAEVNDLCLWGFDKDLSIICAHTGQPYDDER